MAKNFEIWKIAYLWAIFFHSNETVDCISHDEKRKYLLTYYHRNGIGIFIQIKGISRVINFHVVLLTLLESRSMHLFYETVVLKWFQVIEIRKWKLRSESSSGWSLHFDCGVYAKVAGQILLLRARFPRQSLFDWNFIVKLAFCQRFMKAS